jgi:hypothetical protein
LDASEGGELREFAGDEVVEEGGDEAATLLFDEEIGFAERVCVLAGPLAAAVTTL